MNRNEVRLSLTDGNALQPRLHRVFGPVAVATRPLAVAGIA